MFTPRPHSRNFRRAAGLFTLLLSVLAVGGCQAPPAPKIFLQFYLQSPDVSGVAFTMPLSKLDYRRLPEAFLNSADITSVNEGFVTVAGERTACVFFQFSPLGTHELMMQSASNVGRKIFLFSNGQPLGVRPIDQVIQSGQLFVFVEEPDQKALEQFVADVQSSQQRIAEMKKKQ